jgi:predicted RNase H-like nuclease (RuvC/YqgF family)
MNNTHIKIIAGAPVLDAREFLETVRKVIAVVSRWEDGRILPLCQLLSTAKVLVEGFEEEVSSLKRKIEGLEQEVKDLEEKLE